MPELPAILRPNGKLYHPTKIVARPFDESYQGDDSGVVILGTHDIDAARPLAVEAVRHFHGVQHAIRPMKVWWRDGHHYGDRQWVWDDVRGRAGVAFIAADAPDESVAAAPVGEEQTA